ncbi:type II toxin-antitoxin system HicA family toxin [Clostridium paridis]|uniref:Tetratricopeptide repeat protein n=1 Tax=Clostridium paridis TaxID=2803863 RepID=A0A937K3F6_9CLOT|nr:type II toxin-antitoxin system HicA family toxin [Clostridium paridis]MBL4930433.1 hypothetical protein [Clostridium paridis]
MAVSKKRKKKSKPKRTADKARRIMNFNTNSNIKEIIDNFKIESITKALEYMDSVYMEVQLKSEEYFHDTFDAHNNSLIESINKLIDISEDELDRLVKGHAETWLSEINRFGESFLIKTISYVKMTLNEGVETVFYDLYYQCGDEDYAREALKKVMEETGINMQGYSDIYIEEFDAFSRQLLIAKSHIITNTIRKCLKEKSVDYKYESKIFNNWNVNQLIYIDKYKELSKMAEEYGYIHVRDNGGHGIFTNNETKNIVVIPQGRSIGKGLSFAIQKQILGRSNAKKTPDERTNNQLERKNKLLEYQNNKELRKMAEKYGYIHVRDNGRHAIFTNNKTKNTVVIPQGRSIGKGLSIVIQKQILGRSNAKDLINIIDEQSDLFTIDSESSKKVLELREMQLISDINPYFENEDFESALKILLKFSDNFPGAVKVFALIAGIYEASGNSTKAIEYYKKYIDRNGEMYDAYTRIIELLKNNGQYEESEHYEIIRSGKFSGKISMLENIKDKIEKEEFDAADVLIEEFENEDFSNLSADDFMEIGQSYFKVRNYKLAREYSNKSLQIYSDKAEAKQLIMVMDIMNV